MSPLSDRSGNGYKRICQARRTAYLSGKPQRL